MEPSRADARLVPVDVLRGVALLGILVINVRWFSTPALEVMQPSLQGVGLDQRVAWGLGTLLFQDKMIALFSLLFGAGIGLAASRALSSQLWRLVLLFGIGAAHAYGLWYGDVLMVYAVCGVVVVLLRRAPVALLTLLGVLCFLYPVYERAHEHIYVVLGETPPGPTGYDESRSSAYSELFGAAERSAHTEAGFLEQARWRAQVIRWWQFGSTFNLLRCGGLMLLGLVLMRLGFLTGAARARTYAVGAGVGLPLGLGLAGLGMLPTLGRALGTGAPSPGEQDLGWCVAYIGAGITAIGIASLVFLCLRAPLALRLSSPLAAVGRMALTGYLAQTLVAVLVYEGWAGGHWGMHDPLEQVTVVGWSWLGLLVLCPLWLAYFRLGPAEWLWRSLTTLRAQPMGVGSEP